MLGLLATSVALVYVSLALGGRARVLGAAPDLAVLVPLLLAMHGRPRGAFAAIFLCAAAKAPFSAEPLWLLPLVYGGVAAGLFSVREHFFRTHPITESLTVAVVSLLATAAVESIHLARFGAPGATAIAIRSVVTGLMTGALAPIAFRALRTLPTVRGSLLPARR